MEFPSFQKAGSGRLEKRMIVLSYSRESVCLGDDAGSGEYRIELPDTAVLGDLIHVIMHGGSGNEWPIPYTGANSFWVIRADHGNLADIFTDGEGDWNIRYLSYSETTPLKPLGLTRVFAARGLDPADKRQAYHGYKAANMTGKEIRNYLSDAYSRVGPYHEPGIGEKIPIHRYQKIQDDRQYLVYYNDSFFKIMDAETGRDLYFITYIKKEPGA